MTRRGEGADALGDRPLTVRFVIPQLRLGGQFETSRVLSSALSETAVDADLLLPDGLKGPARPQLAAYAAAPGWLGKKPREFLHLRRRLRELPPHSVAHFLVPFPALTWIVPFICPPGLARVVQFQGLTMGREDLSFRRLLDAPLYYSARGLLNHRAWVRWATRYRAEYLVTSRYHAQQLDRDTRGRIRPWVIPNIADPELFAAGAVAQDEARTRLGVPGDGPWVGYLGHTYAVKGTDRLPGVFKRIAQLRPDVRFALALGEGRRRPLLRGLDRSGLHPRTVLFDLVDPRTFLSALDVLVLPYRSLVGTTLYPSVVLEACALGVPVATVARPPLTELLDDGETACFADHEDDAAIAAAVLRLLENETLRQRMRSAQRRLTREKLSPASVTRGLMEIYRHAARRHQR